MRSILFDELQQQDIQKLTDHLADICEASNLGGVFWLNLPPDLLTVEQAGHADTCGPHRLAVVLEDDSMRIELLVRSEAGMRCTCIGYATASQREFALNFADRLLADLQLET